MQETVATLVDHWANKRPGETFLIAPEPGREISFAEMQAMLGQVAADLDRRGVPRGGKVAFLMDNGLWTAVLFLGIMYAGRTVVPLNAVSGPANIGYVLEHSDTRTVFVSSAYASLLARSVCELRHPPEIVPAEPDTGPSRPVRSGSGTHRRPESTDDALLIYTSGTTGRPKGVVHTQSSAIAGARNTVVAHGLSSSDRGLCVLPLYHINGEIVTVMAPLLSGGSVVMPRRFSTGAFWRLLTRYRCTWFSVVPTIIAYLLDESQKGGDVGTATAAPCVRFGRSASSALPPATHRAFEARFGVPIVETMGLSETAAQILSNPAPPARGKVGSPGLPFVNEVRVVDADGKVLPPGVPGELVVRGANVMKGYYKNPDATREAITPGGWLRTGDMGYCDADGYFFVTGRLKELIIKGGENIAPREIDDVLYSHQDVLEGAAFAVPDAHYGEEVMACVVPRDMARASAQEIRAYCVDALGHFKAPKEVLLVDALPKGPSGKVQRLKIAEMLADSREPVVDGQS